MFVNEGASFSETFREQMATQLLNKFYLMLGIWGDIKRLKFHLHVGMTPLNTMCNDSYAFAIVDILNPISFAKSVTVYWKPNNGEKPENASKLDIWDRENIEFGWCMDFNENDFLKYLHPRNVITKEQLNSTFDYEYDYSSYPDLSFTICFNQKVFQDEIAEMEEILSTVIKNTYISELTTDDEQEESGDKNEVMVILDFHNNDFETSTQQLVDAFIKIGKTNVGNKII
jgi:hypothetical protein